MSRRERYEEMDRQFDGLKLPDQEQSWQKMKQKLDEDKERRRILPPLFLNCLGWGLVLMAGLTAAWFFLKPANNSKEKTATTQSTPASSSQPSSSSVEDRAAAPKKFDPTSKQTTDKTTEVKTSIPTSAEQTTAATKSNIDQHPSHQLAGNSRKLFKTTQRSSIRVDNGGTADHPQHGVEEIKEPSVTRNDSKVVNRVNDKNSPEKNKSTEVITNNTENTLPPQITNSPKQDSTLTAGDSLTPNSKTQIPNPKRKTFFITAGVGEQQQIPIAGQTAVPYSHYGRKGSVSDYVPSLYVRLQKENKWFVQAEFRYGAAQSVKEFSYNRQTKFDAVSNNITTTTLRLKKTYYHQLPLSFNYFITKNLSVGAGGMYSRFYGAITEQEVKSRNIQTQTEVVTRQIVPIKHFTDSFLYKTQVHALLQADYQWRRFTFGLRYTKDVQPYIKYTNPDGTIDERRNQSLQFIMRFRILQSKKF